MALLDVIDISKKFGKTMAVQGLSFSLEIGEIIGVLGPNGAGKSTTISMIATLLKPDTGDIMYMGNSIIKDPKALQKDLGYVPQEIALYPTMTGLENLKFWGNVKGLTKKVLHENIDDVVKIIGLENRIQDRVDSYSGGMKRRLNLGVALLHQPRLLILDEPTVGIDPQSRQYIIETLLRLRSEKRISIIFTSHYIDEIEELCDKICIVDEGRVISAGTKEELIFKSNIPTRIIIRFEHTENLQLEHYTESIKRQLNIDQIKIDQSNNELMIEVNDGDEVFDEILTLVHNFNAKVLSINTKRPNLESVFFSLTSRNLRDN